MGKLDHNTDAYRLVMETLHRLRQRLREELLGGHGQDWERLGIPDETREHLVGRRAREAAVSWRYSSGSDLLDFAGFINLFEIIAANQRLKDTFATLLSEPDVLRLRFLELDTILNRLAYAREITESDMELLLGFEERLRRLDARSPKEPPPPAVEAAKTVETGSAARERRATPQAAPAASPAAGAKSEARRPASPALSELDSTLGRGDDARVLTALYHEVTAVAEGLWTDPTEVQAPVWEKVRESEWYRKKFAPLNLRTISDFYDLADAAQQLVTSGKSRSELQDFLKDRNFAELLLKLRDLFHPLQTNPGARTGARPSKA
jgi:hypothetical protein